MTRHSKPAYAAEQISLRRVHSIAQGLKAT
jgi:hypothetical protein